MLKSRLNLYFLLFFINLKVSYAQKDFSFFKSFNYDAPLGYNFFIGEDSKDLHTTINGLGSGFLDFPAGKISANIVSLRIKKISLFADIGLSLYKYRFTKEIVFFKKNSVLNYYIDRTPEREYGNSFFSYGKSKLVLYSFFIPVKLSFNTGQLKTTIGIFLDIYLSGFQKNKYIEDGRYVKSIIKSSKFKHYNINKTKLGADFSVEHKKTGIKFNAEYFFTPLFKNGVKIQQSRISFIFPVYLLF